MGALAAVENVFPPVPADTAVALGAFLSQFGAVSATLVFGVTWVANIASATAVYLAARTLGRRFFAGRIGRRLLRPPHLARLERLYDRYGTWGIFVSRFIPGVRAVVPPFAGIARLGILRAILPAALASGLWYGALTIAVVVVARSLSDVPRLLAGLNRAGILLVAILAAVAAVIWAARRRRRDPPGDADP